MTGNDWVEFEYMTKESAGIQLVEARNAGVLKLLLPDTELERESILYSEVDELIDESQFIVKEHHSSGGRCIRFSELPDDVTYGLALINGLMFVKPENVAFTFENMNKKSAARKIVEARNAVIPPLLLPDTELERESILTSEVGKLLTEVRLIVEEHRSSGVRFSELPDDVTYGLALINYQQNEYLFVIARSVID